MKTTPEENAMIAPTRLRILLSLLLLSCTTPVFAQGDELPIQRPVLKEAGAAALVSPVFNSNCPQATCDTVWVGHSSSGPGGTFLGVGVGGRWDYDTDVAGTDSTQGWRTHAYAFTSGVTRPANQRPEWALDYGNQVNLGNTNLWHARELAGRKFVKTGIVSAWHADDMAGVKKKLNDGAEPSAVPIAGARSAWCGLREGGNTHAVDPLTGNYINGDLYSSFGPVGPVGVMPDFPGFCSLWDQLLYKDFPSTGTGTVAFRVRTDMSNFVDTSTNGTGWFNPDPTNLANFVNNPADSFMVYVGSPTEVAYDTNRRWLSEILDFSKPVQEVFAVCGKYPAVSPDTAIVRPYAGAQTVGGVVRVVFRIKTNRVRADGIVGTATAYNSKDGAAVLDQVQVDGGTTYGFDNVNDIMPRELAGDIAQASAPWVGTGKPVMADFHVDNVATLLYEDLCGAVGSNTRRCNLAGNVVVAGNHDDSERMRVEFRQTWESPTIDLAVRTAAPGTKNAQGIDHETALRTGILMDYDIYTGFMSLDESIFWQIGGRFHGPTATQPQSGNRAWSPSQIYPGIIFNPDPFCLRGSNGNAADDISSLGIPAGNVDSLKIEFMTISQGYRFGGTNLGNTRGTYVDNLRAGFTRNPATPALSQEIWNKYQDQFPWNEGVGPGDNASFDTTTALVRSGLNIVAPANAPGVVPGDSITANAPFSGDGVTSGVRMDLVFRIDPGPGNYVVKGNRGSALVNKDPAHPFFATYLANNGPYGTPGGHGATWNRDVWNSARMDSADVNVYPILSRGIGGPATPVWMGALHELDPNFTTLGISHSVCFLIDPNGTTDGSNLSCSGTPPAPYGAVGGTTKEGTKILPDGWFTPGTHVEYFVRKSLLESPGTVTLLFDTTQVFPQDFTGNADFDQERWSSFDVLPDMWKSTRYFGQGLACLLVIDDNDRRGADAAFRGALDTLGYGKRNGATQGWLGLGPNSDPNDPAGFVAANLGQYGLNYDHYDIRASESDEAGHPGVRFATNPGAIALKRDTSGPSAQQLASLYTSVLWLAGDLSSGTLHDGFDSQESAPDIFLLDGFLAGATPANRRGVWLDGDGIMEDGALNSDNGTFLYPFLTDDFGADLVDPNYKARSGSPRNTFGFFPTAPWAHPGRVYGIDMNCLTLPDVLSLVATVDGAAEGAQYENLGPAPWMAAIYRPTGASRDYRTLIDGFDLANLRGNYANLGQIATKPASDFARAYWLDDAVAGHFQICARRGGFAGVGDLPGISPARFANANLGSYPNPAFAGRTVSLRFTLARAMPVTLRIYDVAGRAVAHVDVKGVEGPNVAAWDGLLANGARAAAGVYFYALEGVPAEARASKMILLSAR
jgi:hypothetical protein